MQVNQFKKYNIFNDEEQYHSKRCPDCGGLGYFWIRSPWSDPANCEKELCETCEGKGYIE